MISLYETYLDFSNPFNGDILEISDYNLIHLDHPSNNEHGGIYIYYTIFLL